MVASAHPLASRVGLEILQKGGNAVDAAVATAFALGVVEPNASGIGGGGFILIKMGNNPPIFLDYREIAPEAASADLFYPTAASFDSMSRRGVNSIAVPGVPAGLITAAEKFGSLTLSELIAPSIRLARDGFAISKNLANIIFQNYDLILQNPATAAIFLEDELPPSAGHLLVNSKLAQSLESLALNGPAAFYQGDLGASIIRTIQAQGGVMVESDLEQYGVIQKNPVQGTYRGYDIYSAAPAAGGVQLIELLNILENFEIQKFSPKAPAYLHLLAEAMKMAFQDKLENMADPAFFEVPVDQLTSKTHAKTLAGLINPKKASFNYKAPSWIRQESGSTTHLSVVDDQRNTVALTQSINFWFGSGITDPESGILLNNHMNDFSKKPEKPNSVEPLKRPVSSIAPTIVLKDGKLVLTIGTPGGTRIISALAQIIVNLVDFGMGIDQAIEAPRIHAQDSILHMENRFPETAQTDLKQLGHPLKLHQDYDSYFGGAQGILFDLSANMLIGGADSRRDGFVEGY
jgi:gamma-glutamyltranspeptidase/glutathione hydrolase